MHEIGISLFIRQCILQSVECRVTRRGRDSGERTGRCISFWMWYTRTSCLFHFAQFRIIRFQHHDAGIIRSISYSIRCRDAYTLVPVRLDDTVTSRIDPPLKWDESQAESEKYDKKEVVGERWIRIGKRLAFCNGNKSKMINQITPKNTEIIKCNKPCRSSWRQIAFPECTGYWWKTSNPPPRVPRDISWRGGAGWDNTNST